jgi:dTDP-glucose pyrophosphorylase
MEVKNPEKYGICSVDENGNLVEIIEKPQIFVGNLANTGCIKADEKLLEEVQKTQMSPR